MAECEAVSQSDAMMQILESSGFTETSYFIANPGLDTWSVQIKWPLVNYNFLLVASDPCIPIWLEILF